MSENIIVDTSCLILLEKLERLEILQKVFVQDIVVTPTIVNEFSSDLPEWVKVREAKDKKYQRLLNRSVDSGEASAIALGVEIEGLLILDDRKARTLASDLDLDVTGTLGLLIDATKDGYLSSFRYILMRIKQTNFHISEELERNLLDLVNELDG
jgi:predicted nucleic acid-binding protein